VSVKIRLMRMGKKKQPTYRVVVADGRSPRDGRFIEIIGRYAPRDDPSALEIDSESALAWLRKGAQPTDRVQKLLAVAGVWQEYEASRSRTAAPAKKRAATRAPKKQDTPPAASDEAAAAPAETEATDATDAAAGDGET
jgi:small subunit ribosomal protein S16